MHQLYFIIFVTINGCFADKFLYVTFVLKSILGACKDEHIYSCNVGIGSREDSANT